MFLNVGQEVSFADLLTGISVVSANDACVVVAEHLTGSEELFVRAMNERAATLGMTNTRFENSTGLPSAGHYMSARDIAMLSREIVLHQPELLKLESQMSFTFNDITQQNRNPLLGRYTGPTG
jgi:serine-type D-Ala-D-Ala carboxypeptidase (penicillin-binding protein 5/6)